MPCADWTRQAEADLEAIYVYIARRDRRLSVAKNVVHKIRDHCNRYANLTAAGHELGTARDDLGDGIRIFSHQRWVVIIRPNVNGIEVLRIFDGSRDYKHLFLGQIED